MGLAEPEGDESDYSDERNKQVEEQKVKHYEFTTARV